MKILDATAFQTWNLPSNLRALLVKLLRRDPVDSCRIAWNCLSLMSLSLFSIAGVQHVIRPPPQILNFSPEKQIIDTTIKLIELKMLKRSAVDDVIDFMTSSASPLFPLPWSIFTIIYYYYHYFGFSSALTVAMGQSEGPLPVRYRNRKSNDRKWRQSTGNRRRLFQSKRPTLSAFFLLL